MMIVTGKDQVHAALDEDGFEQMPQSQHRPFAAVAPGPCCGGVNRVVQEDHLPSRPRIRQRIPEPHQLGIFDGCLLIDEHDILAKLRVELLEPSPFRLP